ncbi:hypothetical protein J4G37_52180, partial [Microvirga sp. 3-52]|nr:hypothetical protein [Microvirga sp. 3-52]
NYKNRFIGWFTEGERRELSKRHLSIFSFLALLLAMFQVWSVVWGKLNPMNQMAIHLAVILSLTFLLFSYSKRTVSTRPTMIDYIASILAFGAGLYFTMHAERFAVRIPIMEPLTNVDIFFGMVFVLLSIEA